MALILTLQDRMPYDDLLVRVASDQEGWIMFVNLSLMCEYHAEDAIQLEVSNYNGSISSDYVAYTDRWQCNEVSV